MSLLLDYHQQPVIFNSIHGDNIGKWTDEPTMNRADNAQYRKTLVEHLYMNTGSELGAQRARKAQQDNVNRLADEREYNEEMEGGGDNEHLWYKPHPSQVQLPQHRSF